MFQGLPLLKLEKREIDGLPCPSDGKDVMHFDDALKGFALRVSAKGVKTFVFQYRRGAIVRRLILGRYHGERGTMTPAQARSAALIAAGQVKAGGDPVADRASAVATEAAARMERKERAAMEAFTLGKLVDQWEAKSLSTKSASHRREAPAAIRRTFAKFLSRPIDSLTHTDLQHVLDVLAKAHPIMAMRVRSYARAMANWALKRELISANPFARLVVEAREVSRDRVLSDAELGAAWRAASAMPYPFGPYVRMLILTLQRRQEVAAMRWAELDVAYQTWTLPAERAKNKKEHIIPLPRAARAIMQKVAEVPRLKGQELVFTTTGATPISGFTRAQAQLVRAMQKEAAGAGDATAGTPAADWHLHDFRRTGVTAMAKLGVAPHVADKMLNHVEGTIRGVAAVYQRHAFMAEREAAAELWAKHVLAVAGDIPESAVPLPANVVRLDQKRRK